MASNSGNIKFIKNKDLTFKKLFLHYIKDDELLSLFHLFLSILTTIIFVLIVKSRHNYEIVNSINEKIISASTDILGVLIASFGLFAAITDQKFSEKVYKLGELRNILFPFWFCSTLWVINLISGYIVSVILYPVETPHIKNVKLYLIILYYILTLFLITIGYTLALIGDILKRTIEKVQLDYMENMKKSDATTNTSLTVIEAEIPKRFYNESLFHIGFTIFTLTYILCWYYYIDKYRYLDILFYTIIIFYAFYTYKLHKKLKNQEFHKLFYRLRFVLKLLMLIISFWLVILI